MRPYLGEMVERRLPLQVGSKEPGHSHAALGQLRWQLVAALTTINDASESDVTRIR